MGTDALAEEPDFPLSSFPRATPFTGKDDSFAWGELLRFVNPIGIANS